MTHRITDETRERVKALVFAGIKVEKIASVLGISKSTLKRRYRSELDNATAEAVGQVAQSLLSQAIAGNTVAGIFVMKSRANWRDSGTGDEQAGTPVQIVINPPDYPRESYEKES